MMLVPRKNSFDLFDDFLDDDFFRGPDFFPPKKERNLMKTDIKEKKDKFILEIDLPGFEKDKINMSLENGYLKIHAKVNKEEKKEDDERFVHRERFVSECSRSFYIGEDIKEEEIHAEFKNGILRVEIPKKEALGGTKEVKQIPIK